MLNILSCELIKVKPEIDVFELKADIVKTSIMSF